MPHPPLSRARRLIVCLSAVALAAGLTSCGQQVGAAAIVGSFSISTDSVDAQARSLTSVGQTLSTDLSGARVLIDTSRRILTDEIRHQLLAQSGLAVPLSDDQVAQAQSAYQGSVPLNTDLMATPENLNARIGDATTLNLLVSKAVAAGTVINGPSVNYDAIVTPDVAAAESKRTSYMADPAAMTADVESARATNSGGQGTISLLQASALVGTGLFSAQPGEIVVADLAASGGLIARITSRSESALALTSTTLSQLAPSQVDVVGGLLLAQMLTSQALQVQVNPRFGVWDPAVLQVVAAPGRV